MIREIVVSTLLLVSATAQLPAGWSIANPYRNIAPGQATYRRMAIDEAKGIVYLTGASGNSFTYGGAGPYTTNNGVWDCNLHKADLRTGQLIWSRVYGSSTWDSCGCLDFDQVTGDVYVGGDGMRSPGDSFLLKWDINGTLLWSVKPQDTADEESASEVIFNKQFGRVCALSGSSSFQSIRCYNTTNGVLMSKYSFDFPISSPGSAVGNLANGDIYVGLSTPSTVLTLDNELWVLCDRNNSKGDDAEFIILNPDNGYGKSSVFTFGGSGLDEVYSVIPLETTREVFISATYDFSNCGGAYGCGRLIQITGPTLVGDDSPVGTSISSAPASSYASTLPSPSPVPSPSPPPLPSPTPSASPRNPVSTFSVLSSAGNYMTSNSPAPLSSSPVPAVELTTVEEIVLVYIDGGSSSTVKSASSKGASAQAAASSSSLTALLRDLAIPLIIGAVLLVVMIILIFVFCRLKRKERTHDTIATRTQMTFETVVDTEGSLASLRTDSVEQDVPKTVGRPTFGSFHAQSTSGNRPDPARPVFSTGQSSFENSESSAGYPSNKSTSMSTTLNALTIGNSQAVAIPGFLMINADTIRLESLIGEGGAAHVHHCQILLPQYARQKFAAKIFDKSFAGFQSEHAFHQELAIMHMLNKSPYICKLIAYTDDPQIMVMKYYEYGTLRRWVKITENVTRTIVVDFSQDIAHGLKELHFNGIVHLDIKPANILIDYNMEKRRFICVLTDFGISRIVSVEHLLVREFHTVNLNALSFYYAAPELIQKFRSTVKISSPLSPQGYKAADVYSYGIVLYSIMKRGYI